MEHLASQEGLAHSATMYCFVTIVFRFPVASWALEGHPNLLHSPKHWHSCSVGHAILRRRGMKPQQISVENDVPELCTATVLALQKTLNLEHRFLERGSTTGAGRACLQYLDFC
jgi:hypothetical protein